MLLRPFLLLSLALSPLSLAADLPVVPAVHLWQPAEGALRVSSVSLEVSPADAEALKAPAAAIREDLAALLGDTTRGGKASLQMTADGRIFINGSQISVDATGPLQISGNDVDIN